MEIVIASDHAGYSLKKKLKEYLKKAHPDFIIKDLGCKSSSKSVDYPDYAFKASEFVSRGKAQRAILICGTGIGMCICANKVKGIRAGVVHDVTTARLTYSHTKTDVICLGARIIAPEIAIEIVEEYLSTPFDTSDERHRRRIEKISQYEKKYR